MFFASIYWLTNQMTSVRADVGAAVFQWERAIPFIDWTIIPYGSIVAFFVASFFLCRSRAELNCHTARLVTVVLVSVVCFVLWPQRFVFERPVVDGALGVLFQLLTAVDLPYNRTPSLHISVLVILWALFARCTQGWMRHAVYAWFALIGVSVLTTYQHHVIDVPAGVLQAGYACGCSLSPVSRGSLFSIYARPDVIGCACVHSCASDYELLRAFPSDVAHRVTAACNDFRVRCAKRG